ncbi:MAG: DUF4440 domain-containing protein [Bacteroidota bacterium]
MEKSVIQYFRDLEDQLLNQEMRRLPEQLELLISDDFIEFGSSGRTYNKHEVIDAMLKESPRLISAVDFTVTELAQGIVLVTYCAAVSDISKATTTYSRRSSIWKNTNGNWEIVFHQGTPFQV